MCIFCKIVNGEIPNNTVHESEHFLAFHDLYPKAPIHILIIPKLHVDCFPKHFTRNDGRTHRICP